MRKAALGVLIGALLVGGGALAASATVPAYVAAAIADTGRPKADVDRDADRKPAQMLAFAGVKPGPKLAELLPGGGYFTRIFSKAVGAKGHVFAVIPPPQANAPSPAVQAIAADAAYANVTVHPQPFTTLDLPEKVDLVWTSQNYHDLHLKRFNLDVGAVNKAVFAALKPGGYYVVLDHAAAAGAPVDVADTLHRIDPAIVRREVEAAGFKYVGEDSSLRNTADDHSKVVFDPAIRGHTDQFIYKFQKPK
jgi:predicted methyltransferase